MSEVPRFCVVEVERDPVRLIGELSSTHYGSEQWVRSGSRCDLRVGNRFITGRWAEAGRFWAFSPETPGSLEAIGDTREFEVFDGYWAERAEIILDESLKWSETTWSDPSDHRHCNVCWATIDLQENTRHFQALPSFRVCPRCFSSYVEPRSINLVALGGPAA